MTSRHRGQIDAGHQVLQGALVDQTSRIAGNHRVWDPSRRRTIARRQPRGHGLPSAATPRAAATPTPAGGGARARSDLAGSDVAPAGAAATDLSQPDLDQRHAPPARIELEPAVDRASLPKPSKGSARPVY